MDVFGSIIYYIICITILYIFYSQITNRSYNAIELFAFSTILYIFYILYLISLLLKNKNLKKFNNDDRNISIIIIISIILIEYLNKGKFNKTLVKSFLTNSVQ